MIQTVDRRDRLDAAIARVAGDSEFTDVVNRLCCLRGVSTLTGFGLAVEISDWTRLDGHRIGAYVGLTPSESSSGASRALGGITKTGNGHARRLLIEAAWHHRPAYRPTSPIMRARRDQTSQDAGIPRHRSAIATSDSAPPTPSARSWAWRSTRTSVAGTSAIVSPRSRGMNTCPDTEGPSLDTRRDAGGWRG